MGKQPSICREGDRMTTANQKAFGPSALLCLCAAILTQPAAQAETDRERAERFWNKYLTPETMTISIEDETTGEQVELVEQSLAKQCFVSKADANGINWANVIRIGKAAWEIVEANKAVVQTHEFVAHAVPEGLTEVSQLAGFKPPHAGVFSVGYKNGFGAQVVTVKVRLTFSPGGSLDGRGRYIKNITVSPATVDVGWGYTVNMSSKMFDVLNAGSKTNPLAAVEIRLDWTVETILKTSVNSAAFYLRGDGLIQQIAR